MNELLIRFLDACFILTWAAVTGWSLFGSRQARRQDGQGQSDKPVIHVYEL